MLEVQELTKNMKECGSRSYQLYGAGWSGRYPAWTKWCRKINHYKRVLQDSFAMKAVLVLMG